MSHMPIVLPTEKSRHEPSRRDRGVQNTFLDIPPGGVGRSALSRKQWRPARSKLGYFFEVGKHEEDRIGLGSELLF